MSKKASSRGQRKPCVFIHANQKQMLGAHVGEKSLRYFSSNNDKFDVKFIETKDHPFLQAREGEKFLRNGVKRKWCMNDLQSFSPLRFLPPELMNYQGRAVVIDPDVFAVGDVWDLLSQDMAGRAIMCQPRSKISRDINGTLSSSVMLLDCAQLGHWQAERQFNEMFDGQRDYNKWISLMYEDRSTLGLLENNGNDLDLPNHNNNMSHTGEHCCQSWNTGLPIDFVRTDNFDALPPLSQLLYSRRKIFGNYSFLKHYKTHPGETQEDLFFTLLLECFDEGSVTGEMVQNEMQIDHIRQTAINSSSSNTRPNEKFTPWSKNCLSVSSPPPQSGRLKDSAPLQAIACATAQPGPGRYCHVA